MSLCKRVIARIDVKGTRLIKGIQFEGLRVIGDAWETSKKYSSSGIDEIFYSDAVASLYERNSLSKILKKTSRGSFIPITAGGGIRTVEDGRRLLANGADKLAINTHAVKNPNLINQLAETFGKQCVVVSVQARRSIDGNGWSVMIESGRERSDKILIDWILEVQDRGAGEIFLTSVDQDGMGKGPDSELINSVDNFVSVPLVVGGGFSTLDQIKNLFNTNKAPTGVAIGWAFHNSNLKIKDVKDVMKKENIIIRDISLNKKKFSSRNLKVSILEYGMGNLESLFNAFKYIGTEVQITDSLEELEKADLVAIPGVGSFPKGISKLKNKNLVPLLEKRFRNKNAVIGICLGMQLLFTKGEEFGETKGLNFFKGNVKKLPTKNNLGEKITLPHVGWNKINFKKNHEKYSFQNNDQIYQYFVHSYSPKLDIDDIASVLCETEYEGHKFVSAVNKDNIYGLQFHPERSGDMGLVLLNDIITEIRF